MPREKRTSATISSSRCQCHDEPVYRFTSSWQMKLGRLVGAAMAISHVFASRANSSFVCIASQDKGTLEESVVSASGAGVDAVSGLCTGNGEAFCTSGFPRPSYLSLVTMCDSAAKVWKLSNPIMLRMHNEIPQCVWMESLGSR